jgi:hypothetical protein
LEKSLPFGSQSLCGLIVEDETAMVYGPIV